MTEGLPPPKPGGIMYNIEITLLRAGYAIINFFNEQYISSLERGWRAILSFLATVLAGFFDIFIERMLTIEALPLPIKSTMIEIKVSKEPSAKLMGILIAIIGIFGYLSGPMSVGGLISQREASKQLRPNIPNMSEIIAMMRRHAADASMLSELQKESGYNDEIIKGYQEILHIRLDESGLANALYRNKMSPAEIRNELLARGYDEKAADILIDLFVQIPPVQDLIRMAVRDTWNEKAVAQYGYDEDYPVEVGQWTEKLGIPKEWALRYWRAHWQLPAVGMGYEMLHRDIISKPELELLLRISDIPKFWREKLIDMSYNVFTRVDTRRMYALKILDEEGVFKAYLEQGYDSDKAAKLSEWTFAEYGEASKELSRGDIINSFVDDFIDEATATSYLEMLKYGPEEIKLLLSRAKLKKQQDFEKEFINNIKIMFVAGQIDEIRVANLLAEIKATGAFIEYNLKLWRLQKERAIKRPALKDILSFFSGGIISYDEFVAEMRRQGYSELYIDWYSRLVESQVSA